MYLFIHLFNFGKALLQIYIDFHYILHFKMPVEMNMITRLLHLRHSCKYWSELVETNLEEHNIGCSSTISAARAQYQYLLIRI